MSAGLPYRRLVLALLANLSLLSSEADPFDFSNSYAVGASYNGARCTFAITDVIEDAQQLTQQLRNGYDVSTGVELLTFGDVPARCTKEGMKALRRAGFHHIRVRRGTDKDHFGGLPTHLIESL